MSGANTWNGANTWSVALNENALLGSGGGGGGSVNSVSSGNANITITGTATDPIINGTLVNLTSNVNTSNFALSGNTGGNPSFVLGGGEAFKIITTDLTPHILIDNTNGVQLGLPSGYGGYKVTAPTVASSTTNDTQVATTAFVQSAIAGISPTIPTLQQVANAGNGISNYVAGSTATLQSTNFSNDVALTLNGNTDTGLTHSGVKMISNTDASKYVAMDYQRVNLNGTDYTWSSIVAPTVVNSLGAGTNINLTGTANNPVVNVNTALTALTANPVSADSKLLQFNRTIEATTSPQSVPAPTYPKETATLINNSSSIFSVQNFFTPQAFNSVVPMGTNVNNYAYIAVGDQVAFCDASGAVKAYSNIISSGTINCALAIPLNDWTVLGGAFTTVGGHPNIVILDSNYNEVPFTNGVYPPDGQPFQCYSLAWDNTTGTLWTGSDSNGGIIAYYWTGSTWGVVSTVGGLDGDVLTMTCVPAGIPSLGLGSCVSVGGNFTTSGFGISPCPYWFFWDGTTITTISLYPLTAPVRCSVLDGTDILYGGDAFGVGSSFPYSYAFRYNTLTNTVSSAFSPQPTIPVYTIGASHYGGGSAGVGTLHYATTTLTSLSGIVRGYAPLTASAMWVSDSGNGSYEYPVIPNIPIVFNTTIPIVPSGLTTITLQKNGDTVVLQASDDLSKWFILEQPATSFSAGTTGLTPAVASTGAVVLGGTLAVANGGTGVITSTGTGSTVLSNSPALTGIPTAPTATPYTDNTTKIATTAFVQSAIAGSISGVSSFSAGTTGLTPSTATTGAVVLSGTLAVANGGTGVSTSTGTGSTVLSISPALTGNPTAPTQTFGFRTTGIANTLFVSDAIRNVINYTVSASPVNLLTSSQPYLTTTGSLAYVVNLPDATTLQVGRLFYINNNTNAVGNTITINNFAGTTLVSNGQQGTSYKFILLTNSTSAGTWDIHSYLPTGANFGTSGLVYQGNLTFTGSGTSVISNSGSGSISITAPTLTGVPLAPTAVAGTNTTQIATTAFVQTAVAGAVVPTYNQVLNAGATATSKTATINDGGTNSTAVSATNFTATTSAGNTVFSADGYVATNGTNTITATAITPSITVATTGASSVVNSGSFQQNNNNSGYTNNQQLTITNNNSTAGATTGVPSESFYKAGRNAVSSDIIGSTHYFAKNSAGTKTEFARMESQARTITAGAETGYWGVNVAVAGVSTNFLNCNANTNSINTTKNIDMNGQILKTSSSNITIDASTSSGVGSIIQTLKAGGNLIINNLPTSSAGLPTNAVWRNGNVLNIV